MIFMSISLVWVTDFWIGKILVDQSIIAKHRTFTGYEDIREAFCSLVWGEDSRGFVKSTETARFFLLVGQTKYVPRSN